MIEVACLSSIAAFTLKELVGLAVFVIGAAWLALWYRRLSERERREELAELAEALPGQNWQFQETVKRSSEPDLSVLQGVFKVYPFARRDVADGAEYVFRVPLRSGAPYLEGRAVAVRRMFGLTLPRIGLVRNLPGRFFLAFSSPEWFAENWPDLSHEWKLDCALPEREVRHVLDVLTSVVSDLDNIWEIHTSGECFACAGPHADPGETIAAYRAAYRSLEIVADGLKSMPRIRE